MTARWRPYTFSRASEISPTVARARAASTASASRLPSPDSAAAVSAFNARSQAAASRSRRTRSRRATWASRTAVLSMSSTSTSGSSSSWYLFTPTITSSPRSMRACFRAAASSIRSLGMPDSTAFVMPPRASTSSISLRASTTMAPVRLSR